MQTRTIKEVITTLKTAYEMLASDLNGEATGRESETTLSTYNMVISYWKDTLQGAPILATSPLGALMLKEMRAWLIKYAPHEAMHYDIHREDTVTGGAGGVLYRANSALRKYAHARQRSEFAHIALFRVWAACRWQEMIIDYKIIGDRYFDLYKENALPYASQVNEVQHG